MNFYTTAPANSLKNCGIRRSIIIFLYSVSTSRQKNFTGSVLCKLLGTRIPQDIKPHIKFIYATSITLILDQVTRILISRILYEK